MHESDLTKPATDACARGNKVDSNNSQREHDDEDNDNNTHASNTVVNAVPFSSYYAANPGQYKTGQYDGFAIIFAPLRGFENVIINLDATTFVA